MLSVLLLAASFAATLGVTAWAAWAGFHAGRDMGYRRGWEDGRVEGYGRGVHDAAEVAARNLGFVERRDGGRGGA